MPGLIFLEEKIVRTPKVKKWIDKMHPANYKVQYLDNPPTDRSEIERALKALENSFLGISEKPKEVLPENRECKYVYRLNANTVLSAYTEEQFNLLKKWYGIYD